MPRPTHLPPANVMKLAGPLVKKRWFRNLILFPATLRGKRASNKTEDYSAFRRGNSRVERFEQVSLCVTSIAESRNWFEEVGGFVHSRTCQPEPPPSLDAHSLTCCYLSSKAHHECLVLVEHRDAQGALQTPSNTEIFHVAFELEGNRWDDVVAFGKQMEKVKPEYFYGPVRHNDMPGVGDGESGGNAAVYYFTPDWHVVEFCGDMDSVDNYRERYGVES